MHKFLMLAATALILAVGVNGQAKYAAFTTGANCAANNYVEIQSLAECSAAGAALSFGTATMVSSTNLPFRCTQDNDGGLALKWNTDTTAPACMTPGATAGSCVCKLRTATPTFIRTLTVVPPVVPPTKTKTLFRTLTPMMAAPTMRTATKTIPAAMPPAMRTATKTIPAAMPPAMRTATKTVPVAAGPTTAMPTTATPTTAMPTTAMPTTAMPTTATPTTAAAGPTTATPTTAMPTTAAPAGPTTAAPRTAMSTTATPTTAMPTTAAPAGPTTAAPVNTTMTTMTPATMAPASNAPATANSTTGATTMTTAAPGATVQVTQVSLTLAPLPGSKSANGTFDETEFKDIVAGAVETARRQLSAAAQAIKDRMVIVSATIATPLPSVSYNVVFYFAPDASGATTTLSSAVLVQRFTALVSSNASNALTAAFTPSNLQTSTITVAAPTTASPGTVTATTASPVTVGASSLSAAVASLVVAVVLCLF